ncbi:CinA family protein [Clostridium cylindrosporum]|uniref:Amidohydrolase, PncC family n=1 Tax=Clostridium cylindrosporum DSM 605 TaxID=1121307 RepID=A0A0J8DG34_CLOCY|nr:nicotinamide-nucleotide amidohydrolase family protein [Clostridium cylindrosporum]KMT23128.1 amidohydrolase, PncC family [Clostridium cylindrosporum DSM 605]
MGIENDIGKVLCDKNKTISIAESLTGGLLCGKLVNFPGISKVLLEGVVSYSIESKIKRLGVKSKTIEEFSDVSSETAIEMARGIAKTSGSNIGISTTGVAGPSGEPLGLVYIGFYIDGDSSFIEKKFSGERQEIRNKAVEASLKALYDKIKGID